MRTGVFVQLARWAIVLAAPAVAACANDPQPTTQIAPVGQPPIGGFVDSASVVVPVGVAVAFAVTSSEATTDSNTVSVDDPALVKLVTTSATATYVLIGQRPGRTTLHAAEQGAQETTMTLIVSPQTATP